MGGIPADTELKTPYAWEITTCWATSRATSLMNSFPRKRVLCSGAFIWPAGARAQWMETCERPRTVSGRRGHSAQRVESGLPANSGQFAEYPPRMVRQHCNLHLESSARNLQSSVRVAGIGKTAG